MRIVIYLILFSWTILFNGQNPPVVFPKDTTKEEKAILILLDSSTANYNRGNYVASLKYNIEVIDLATKINNAALINKGYRYLAYDYLGINDTIFAKESFENAKKYAQLTNDDIALGESFMDLGNLYAKAYSDHKTSCKYYDDAVIAFKRAKDTISLTKVYINRAISNLNGEDYEELYKSLSELEKPPLKYHLNDHLKNNIYKLWGFYYLRHEKDYDQSIKYSLKTVPFFKKNESYGSLSEVYTNLSDGYYGLKKYKEAAEYGNLFREVNIINVKRKTNTISESESIKFQIEHYKKSLVSAEEKSELQEEVNENRTKLIYVLVGVCIAGFVLITALYVAYRKRKILNIKLREKSIKYLEAKHRAEHLSKAKNKFFSTVSHELRTPLYGVIGLSSILLDDPDLKSSHKNDIKSLKFSADYLLALINDVLQINKIESKRLGDEISNFDLKNLITSIINSFEYMRLQNKNKFHVNIDESIPEIISGSSIKLSQILMNLIGNACKFTENGDIYIKVQIQEKYQDKVSIYFEIKDTGMGIAKEKQKIIFDEFAQIENLNDSYQGTGLGLPIVKKLLKLSNSEIHLDSEIEKGTTFSFSLDFEIPSEKVTNEEIAVIDESILEKKKILVVEDNRINQIVTKKILENKGAICEIAENGEIAVKKASKKSYDLILMDLNMPVKSGLEATKDIRVFDKKTPIVALTAVEVSDIQEDIYSTGMNDIVIKPYDLNKFSQVVVKNISQGKGSLFKRPKKVI